MADWTAITGITGIVVSGVVGPTVAARWAASNQARAAENAIALADRAAARSLLDKAAGAVRDAIHLAAPLRVAPILLLNPEVDAGPSGEYHGLEAFTVAGREVNLLLPRVQLMFLSGPVAAAYADCVSAINLIGTGAAQAHQAMRIGREQSDPDYMRYFDDVMEGIKEAEDASARLLAAGHEAIGVRA